MIDYREERRLPTDALIELYAANKWSSAAKPMALQAALEGSHCVISAWDGDRLVGLGNAISDGHLVVYFPHLLVHPDYQRQGIGTIIVRRLRRKYEGFHQQMIVADGDAIEFYARLGFTEAGATQAMWIYDGDDHDGDDR